MYNRLVIEGNAVYEVDEECARRRQGRKGYGGKNRGGGTSGIPSAGTDPVK